jgi:CXXC-20-CXXC protein
MLKKCINCNNNIFLKDFYLTGLFSSYYKYTCPKCGSKYEATGKSVLIYFLIVLSPTIVLTRLNERVITFLWIVISILVLQPLILKLKKI